MGDWRAPQIGGCGALELLLALARAREARAEEATGEERERLLEKARQARRTVRTMRLARARTGKSIRYWSDKIERERRGNEMAKSKEPPKPRPAGDKGKGVHPATPADSHKRKPHQEKRRPKGES